MFIIRVKEFSIKNPPNFSDTPEFPYKISDLP